MCKREANRWRYIFKVLTRTCHIKENSAVIKRKRRAQCICKEMVNSSNSRPKSEDNSPWTFNTNLHSGAECILAAGMSSPSWLWCVPCLPSLFTSCKLGDSLTPTKKKKGTVSETKHMVNSHLARRDSAPCEDFQKQIFKQKHTNLCFTLSGENTGQSLDGNVSFLFLPTDAKRAARISRFASLVALLIW